MMMSKLTTLNLPPETVDRLLSYCVHFPDNTPSELIEMAFDALDDTLSETKIEKEGNE